MSETPRSASHVLVLGGTGMLRGTVEALAARGARVTVTGRRARPRRGSIRFEAVDWRSEAAFTELVERLVPDRGLPDGVIAWVHGAGLPALHALGARLTHTRFVHVRGSAAGSPGSEPSVLAGHPGGLVEAVLGFVPGVRSRWLTDAEIASGVLAAWDGDATRYVVGTVEPWEERP